jgi:hypothetical protein
MKHVMTYDKCRSMFHTSHDRLFVKKWREVTVTWDIVFRAPASSVGWVSCLVLSAVTACTVLCTMYCRMYDSKRTEIMSHTNDLGGGMGGDDVCPRWSFIVFILCTFPTKKYTVVLRNLSYY